MKTKKPSVLALQLPTSTLSIPLGKALYKIYCALTYPAQVGLAYYFFGSSGAILVALLILLNFRGKL
jgi:hypothetical protein